MFELPDLQYSYDALEPYIDAKTMEIHHDKHHAGYTNNLNKLIENTYIKDKSIEDILSNISEQSIAVRNNAGGYYNHSLFWKIMSPDGGGEPEGELLQVVNDNFGFFDGFKDEFSKIANTHFGSGWVWLVIQNDKLIISSTSNQDNPLMDITEQKGFPILTLDVWEHAYYLKYQNKRADYVSAWWNVVNWKEVSNRFNNIK